MAHRIRTQRSDALILWSLVFDHAYKHAISCLTTSLRLDRLIYCLYSGSPEEKKISETIKESSYYFRKIPQLQGSTPIMEEFSPH